MGAGMKKRRGAGNSSHCWPATASLLWKENTKQHPELNGKNRLGQKNNESCVHVTLELYGERLQVQSEWASPGI